MFTAAFSFATMSADVKPVTVSLNVNVNTTGALAVPATLSVIATVGPDRYLVTLSVTTAANQAVAAAPATDAIVNGFRVAAPAAPVAPAAAPAPAAPAVPAAPAAPVAPAAPAPIPVN